ncbi:MAG: hypothetical protein K0R80_1530 [Clostridia bacterium]|nr:hypothetical protein [Clostridia bacterium]
MRKIHLKRFTSILLAILMFITISIPSASTYSDTQEKLVFDGTQSTWAEKELTEAYDYGMTYTTVMQSFQKPITREEFCTLAIKLYEKLSDKKAVPSSNPFKDTTNPEILKAYELKIVKGTSVDTFSPLNKITRQEICVMIYRTLEAAKPDFNKAVSGSFPFKDSDSIAAWAIDSVKFAYFNNIMKGTSATTISPLANTNREQGIILVKRTYDQYKSQQGQAYIELKATITMNNSTPPAKDNMQKFYDMISNDNLAFPKYKTKLRLYASTSGMKPAKLPAIAEVTGKQEVLFASAELKDTTLSLPPILNPNITPNTIEPNLLTIKAPTGPIYSASDYSSFVDLNGDKKCWFYYDLENVRGISKIVYQVSTAPYAGFKEGWKNPIGLVASGEIPASQKEFLIDLGTVEQKNLTIQKNMMNSLIKSGTKATYNPIKQKQKIYYVRAVPINLIGEPIGDPGKGLAIKYGEAYPSSNNNAQKKEFELWSTTSYLGRYSAENPDKPRLLDIGGFSPADIDSQKVFNFHGIDANTKKIIIQVATSDFTTGSEWPNTKNIVYEKSYDLPTTVNQPISEKNKAGLDGVYKVIDSLYPNTIPVPFAKFGIPLAEMQPQVYTKYYVRGIALKPSIRPGEFDLSYSQTVTIDYGYEPPIQWFITSPAESIYDKSEKVKASLPSIRILRYTKAQWADRESLNHYIIYRLPKWDEVQCKWENSQNGKVLRPFYSYYPQFALFINNQTEFENAKAYYENVIVPSVMTVGGEVYFPTPNPNGEEKPWYEELWDGVCEFFENLTYVCSQIVNQVSTAYNDLKAGIIEFAVNLCPIGPLKGAFKMALEGLANYGLIALGLPPTLPNFDDLTSMGAEYLAELALTEAGVLPNPLVDGEDIGKITDSIKDEMKKSNDHPNPNPINSKFLKLNPRFQYRPAYIEVEVKNDSKYDSVPGTFDVNVNFTLEYYNMMSAANGLLLDTPSKYGYGTPAGWNEYADYEKHFKNGLNGNTINYAYKAEKAVYDVFKPIVGQKIPTIKPGESRIIRIYLAPIHFDIPNENYYAGSTMPNYPYGEAFNETDFANMYFNNGNKNYTSFEIKGHFPTAREYLSTHGMLITDPKTDYTFENYGSYEETLQRPVSVDW